MAFFYHHKSSSSCLVFPFLPGAGCSPHPLSLPAALRPFPSPGAFQGLPRSLPAPGLQPPRGLGNTSVHTPPLPALATSFTSFQRAEGVSAVSSPVIGMEWGQSRPRVASFVAKKAESRRDSSPSFRNRGNSNFFLQRWAPSAPRPRRAPDFPRLSCALRGEA